ncbi:hypothetical protein HBN50_00915 [Halobacteriovorax sp. GB3]|uniref:hypothetical protein n=1 Tax=Halobacteriovorax sp. GB3 TaxID=2719615 RepID=UPI002361148F|nr:hypothetical protein [Halobacteriovorax sp. GB3]MDD0851627.1 hypothetical protein [Halobacteriovorax sp. GB3]
MKKMKLVLLIMLVGQSSLAALFPLKCHKEETGESLYLESPKYIRGHFTLLLEYTKMENGEELIFNAGRKEVKNKIEQYTDEEGLTKLQWSARSATDFRRETGEHPNVAGYYRFQLFVDEQDDISTVTSLEVVLDSRRSVHFENGECSLSKK